MSERSNIFIKTSSDWLIFFPNVFLFSLGFANYLKIIF